jgi:hypothetical protein
MEAVLPYGTAYMDARGLKNRKTGAAQFAAGRRALYQFAL